MNTFLAGKAIRNTLLDLPVSEEDKEWISCNATDSEDALSILKDELAHWDLSIHAMAMDDAGNLIDPYGGQQDLEEGLLRHTSPAFSSKPENILSIAVTGAELAHWGFRIAHGTYGLLKKMASKGIQEQLTIEQKHSALTQALAAERPAEFFRILHRCGALRGISKEVNALFDESDSHKNQQLPELISMLNNKDLAIEEKLLKILEQDFGYQSSRNPAQE